MLSGEPPCSTISGVEKETATRMHADHRVRRIGLVEDHTLQRNRTAEILAAESGLSVVCSCQSLPEFVDWLARRPSGRPDLLMLDLSVDRGPDADPDVVQSLVESGLKVLVLSALASRSQVRAVLRAGVSGVLGKRDREEDIVAATWAVLRGRPWITPDLAAVIAGDADRPTLSDQEERAVVLYASGLTLAAVADSIGVGAETAKTYLARAKAKYAAVGRPVRSKVDLGRIAREDGLLGDR